jgi:hypothetical protein
VPGEYVEARALVEARLPQPTVERSVDSLLRELYAEGVAATPEGLLAVDPADGRVLDRSGAPHPTAFRARTAHRRPGLRRLHPAAHRRARLPAERRHGARRAGVSARAVL